MTGWASGVKPSVSEAAFQAQVLDLATYTGWSLRYHTFDARRSEKGFPDLVLVKPRLHRMVFAELKDNRRKPTEEQRRWLEGLRAAGAEAYLWRPRDWEEVVRVLSLPMRPAPVAMVSDASS